MYAIKENGDLRAVSSEMEVFDGEVLYDGIPRWVYDMMRAASEKTVLDDQENAWRISEITAISNQLMALEEEEATGEDAGALPGTRVQWLSYRTKVRAWKEGAEHFPDSFHRPPRPE